MHPAGTDTDTSSSQSLYSVLLVEDEVAIREGIRDIIDWENLGFHFAGEAKNGIEALELFKQLKPHLVITDIRMPLMDGLELVEKLRLESRDVKIVIITGFDEFTYARRAIRLKVQDYLLKPVSPNEISELLVKIKKDLDSNSRASQQAVLSRNLVRQMALFKLISGTDYSDFLEKNLPDEPVLPESSDYVAVIYDFDELYTSINPEEFRIIIEGQNKPGISSLLVLDSVGLLVEILYFSGEAPALELLCTITDAKRRMIEEKSENALSAGIGSMEVGPDGLRNSYLLARESLSQRFVNGGSAVYRPGGNIRTGLTAHDETIINQITDAIDTGSFTELINHFEFLVENLKSVKAAEQQCRDKMTLVISAMLHGISRKRNSPEGSSVLDSSMLIKAAKFKTLNSLRRWFLDIVGLIQEEILEKREDSYLLMAEKARSYIDTHFADASLSLEGLCSYLGTSLSTFSRVFKTYTDTTFSAYLTEVRIREAKTLINRTDLRN